MTEELDVTIHTPQMAESKPFGEMVRTLIFAGIGALSLTREEADSAVKRLKAQGEVVQQEGEKFFATAAQRFGPQRPLQRIEFPNENGLEQFLNRLNIPSKRDIDDLNARIAQLTARMEELQRNRDT